MGLLTSVLWVNPASFLVLSLFCLLLCAHISWERKLMWKKIAFFDVETWNVLKVTANCPLRPPRLTEHVGEKKMKKELLNDHRSTRHESSIRAGTLSNHDKKKKQQAKISSNSRFTPSNFHIVSVRKDDDDDLGRGREAKRNETLKRKQEIERRRGIFSGFHH